MITYIIVMHVAQTFISPLSEYILFIGEKIIFMFMPWFFFKAGMFCKSDKLSITAQRLYKRLLIPWFVFGLIGLIILSLTYGITYIDGILPYLTQIVASMLYTFSMPGNEPLWFLITLFLCQIAHTILHHFLSLSIPFISFSALLLAYIIKFYVPDNILPYTWASILTGMFFYGCGYILRKKQYNLYIVSGACIIMIPLSIYNDTFIDMRTNGILIHNQASYLLYFIRAICGIVIIDYIASKIPIKYFHRSISTYIGKNSMTFYVMHMPIINIMVALTYYGHLTNNIINFCLTITILAIALPSLDYLFRRYWPETLGLKRNKKRMVATDELP